MTTVGADPSSIRQWNELLVLREMRKHRLEDQEAAAHGLRISTLSQWTTLTPATLRQVLNGLESKGWIDTVEPTISGRGRPARRFRLREPQVRVLGVDVGGHAVRAVRLGPVGTVEASSQVRLPSSATSAQRVAAVQDVVTAVGKGVDPDELWMTGLATSGSLSDSGELVTSVALPDWCGTRPLETLSNVLPGLSLVVNDVRAASVAEHVSGAARGVTDALLIHLGRRPTFGLFIGGEIHQGAHGLAGDMSLIAEFPQDQDPRWVHEFSDEPDPVSAALQAVREGRRSTIDAVRGYITRFAPRLALACGIVDPDVFILGGALASVSDSYLDIIEAEIALTMRTPARIVTSPLDQYAPALGAAHLALQAVENRLVNDESGVAPLERSALMAEAPR